ncbi:hypothetical protein M413DRAFT_165838 [Hebeloma cylindrosporum]|uniref:Uncharacterized protein n=1 Tax=Hebeloma cylindrosporum TaxID=76867 RepID=A0A0C2YHY9_HEBCY|nr:hypothetical protein M413DRAFT_165838 [Hebeloma cylindrosporum h7]
MDQAASPSPARYISRVFVCIIDNGKGLVPLPSRPVLLSSLDLGGALNKVLCIGVLKMQRPTSSFRERTCTGEHVLDEHPLRSSSTQSSSRACRCYPINARAKNRSTESPERQGGWWRFSVFLVQGPRRGLEVA